MFLTFPPNKLPIKLITLPKTFSPPQFGPVVQFVGYAPVGSAMGYWLLAGFAVPRMRLCKAFFARIYPELWVKDSDWPEANALAASTPFKILGDESNDTSSIEDFCESRSLIFTRASNALGALFLRVSALAVLFGAAAGAGVVLVSVATG